MKRLLLLSAVVALSCDANRAQAGIVADPYRAADVTWPKHKLKGRTWRYLLEPSSFSLGGLKDEAFVRDAGVAWIHAPSKLRGERADSLFGFSDDPNEKRFVVGEPTISADVRARLKDVPFVFYEPTRCILGLKHEDCDLRVYDRYAREYPDTYLGCVFGEWNSRVMYFLPRKRSAHYLNFSREFPMPCSRDQFYLNFLSYWDMAAGQKGPRVVGLSGPCNLTAIGCERGSTLAALELTGEAHCPWRELMLFTCGAGRQFDVPINFYQAYFLQGCSTCSIPNRSPTSGEDWGIPPNLGYRAIMLGYYKGCNYQQFESFPWGFVRAVKGSDVKGDGDSVTVELTGNGRAVKRAYDFIRSAEGERGEFYAPILLLADRAHGHDGLSGVPSVKTGHGPFANEYQPTAADQFFSDILAIIENDTRGGRRYASDGKINPVAEYQFGLYNSPFADVFDVAIANPATPGRELRADQLAKYPVVISVGGIQWTEELKALVNDYVENGGTFVYPQGEQQLVAKSGLGNVIAMPREPGEMRKMLLQIQREVLPCSYSGDCETVWNAMPDGSWRVCIVNNAGVSKLPNKTEETFHDEFAKKVVFDLPGGATAKELMTGKGGGTVVLPPGEVRVLEIRGMPRHAKYAPKTGAASQGDAAAKKPLRFTPPYEFPLSFKKYGLWNEDCTIKTEWETDEITLEVQAKPKPLEYWQAMHEKENFALQGGVFGVAHGGNGRMFVIVWKNGFWFLRVTRRDRDVWFKGPKADPSRFTKLAVTLRDRYLHFFVDDKEVFSEGGPVFWTSGTAKDTFSGCFRFHRGSDSFMDSAKHSYLGEARAYHAYSKAIYPLKYAAAEYGAKGDGRADDTAAVQRAIDAAAEKTGEVVLGRGVYKVSQLQMRPGVTLSLADGAIVNGCVCARGVRDFTILGPGVVAGDMVFENAERAYVRRLGMERGRCVVRDSKNVVFDGCRGVSVDAPSSTRVLVDGKLLRGKSPEDTGKERSAR